ncbi:hypothetical protein EDC96DRAFT_148658 [Choanephora cucurbitarum]|nr:hypothetical protein EDC96DRAFT_148658 [Choanephora cucurbitarum]
MQIFSTVSISLTSSRKRKRNAECTYVNKVTNLLDLVVGSSDLYVEPGETISAATKMVRVANEHFFGWSSSEATSTNNLSGCKADILLMGGEDVELVVYEFKTDKCSASTKASDDCKATRLNKCIKEVLVRGGVTEVTFSMSWSRNSGKLYMTKKIEGVDVVVGLEDLIYPTTIEEVLSEAFKKTIMSLYKIKKSSKHIIDRYENTSGPENVLAVFLSPKA